MKERIFEVKEEKGIKMLCIIYIKFARAESIRYYAASCDRMDKKQEDYKDALHLINMEMNIKVRGKDNNKVI